MNTVIPENLSLILLKRVFLLIIAFVVMMAALYQLQEHLVITKPAIEAVQGLPDISKSGLIFTTLDF